MGKGSSGGGIPIKTQLLIVTLILVILPLGIVGSVLYFRVASEMDTYIAESLGEHSEIIEILLEREYESPSAETSGDVADILSQIRVGEKGYVFVLDEGGEYILSEGRKSDGKQILEVAEEAAAGEEALAAVREMLENASELPEGQAGVVRYPWRSSPDEPIEEKITVYRYFEPWGWIWGVSAVKEDFGGGIGAIRLITIAFTVVFALLALAAAYIVGTGFSKQISRIDTVMAKAGEGDFTKTVRLRSSVKELKRLSENFDTKLLPGIREMLGRIKEVINYSEGTGEKIASQVEGTLVFTNQMSQKIVEMREQIRGLDGQINEASSAVEQIQATIANVGKQIDQQASSVTETSASIEEMNSSIQSVAKIAEEKQEATGTLLQITEEGGQKVRSTNEIIQDIGVGINDMLDMITIINKVAAQTNLLAMNAAIEAAHAGDAGRGFAVVAEEIRNLSSSTSESAKKISDRLKSIVERIKQATEMSTETGAAFQKIEGEVQEFVNAFQEIASSTAELSTGSEEMLNAVNSLQNIAQEIQDGSEEMKSGSQDINNSLQALKEYSGNTVVSLKELVEKNSNVNYAQSNMTELVIGNSRNDEKLTEEIHKYKTEELEEGEGERISFSEVVRFSIGALLLQEWIVHVRNILNDEESEKALPELRNTPLQEWIDSRAQPLFGEEEQFRQFMNYYRELADLTGKMASYRSKGDTHNVEAVYSQMVEAMKKAKSHLHSLRYTVSDRLENGDNDTIEEL
ncbi:MAG: methyl-accepting chemotaxis protein [Spirochaetaceae bacterium]